MTYRATLLDLPPSLDPGNIAKPQVIHSNSLDDIMAWADGVLEGRPQCSVHVEKSSWATVTRIKSKEQPGVVITVKPYPAAR